MAKKWSEIVGSPDFQALSDDEKDVVREAYFERVIQPAVAPDQVESTRELFYRRSGRGSRALPAGVKPSAGRTAPGAPADASYPAPRTPDASGALDTAGTEVDGVGTVPRAEAAPAPAPREAGGGRGFLLPPMGDTLRVGLQPRDRTKPVEGPIDAAQRFFGGQRAGPLSPEALRAQPVPGWGEPDRLSDADLAEWDRQSTAPAARAAQEAQLRARGRDPFGQRDTRVPDAKGGEGFIAPTGGALEAVKAAPGIAARGLADTALTFGAVLADYGITAPGSSATREDFRTAARGMRDANRAAAVALSDKDLVNLGPLITSVVPTARTLGEGLGEVGRQVVLNLAIPGGIIADAGVRGIDDARLAGMGPGSALLLGTVKALTEGVPEQIGARFNLEAGARIPLRRALTDPQVALEASKRFAAGMGVELGTEQVTAVSNWLVDRVTADPTATLDRLATDMTDAVKATLIQAPGMMAAGKAGQLATRAAQKITAFDMAAVRGFVVKPPMAQDPPDVQVQKRIGTFKALAAQVGIPSAAVQRAIDATDGMPAAKVGPFLKAMVQALQKRGGVASPVDPMMADTLDAPAIEAPQPAAPAGPKTAAAQAPAPSAESAQAGAAEEDLTGLADAPVDVAAREAATSPTNDRPEPTDAQKEAGNYKKGHARIGGLDLSIENDVGSVRRAKADAPVKWETTMRHHYGYIRGTKGIDGEQIDSFIKPGTPPDFEGTVFVVEQQDPATGKPDEHKVMLGFDTIEEAKEAYQSNYQKGWKGMRGIAAVPMAEFKTWLREGDTSQPFSPEVYRGRAQPDVPGTAPVAGQAAAGGSPQPAGSGGTVGPQPARGPGVQPQPAAGSPAAGGQPTVAVANEGGAPGAVGAPEAPPVIQRPNRQEDAFNALRNGARLVVPRDDGTAETVWIERTPTKGWVAKSESGGKSVVVNEAGPGGRWGAADAARALVNGMRFGEPDPVPGMGALREKWKGLAGKPDSDVMAAEEWDKARQRLRALAGDKPGADIENRIQAEVLAEFGGEGALARDKTGDTSRRFNAEWTRRMQAEGDRLEKERDTSGTLANRRDERERQKQAEQTAAAMQKAIAQDIEGNLARVRDMQRQGRLSPEDAQTLLRLAQEATDSLDAAAKLEQFVADKSIPASEFQVGRETTAANDPLPAEPEGLVVNDAGKRLDVLTSEIEPVVAAPAAAPAAPSGGEATSETARKATFKLSDGAEARVVEAATRGQFRVNVAGESYGSFEMSDDFKVSRIKARANWADRIVTEAANTFAAEQRAARDAAALGQQIQAADRAARAEVEGTVEPKTLDELVAALDAGRRVHFDYAGTYGTTLWIEETPKGWVLKEKDDDGGATFTKGGAGAAAWGKETALRAAREKAEFRFTKWKPEADKDAQDRNGLRAEDRQQRDLDAAAQELAGQMQADVRDADFDAAEVMPGLRLFAKAANVPADSLRQAVLKRLRESDLKRADLAKIERALDPTRQKEEAPAQPPAPAQLRDEEAFADDYAYFEGRTLEEEVEVAETGQTMTLRRDAAEAMREVDARLQALRELRDCLARSE